MTCPRCRQDNPPHARFCLQCGQAVTAGTAAPVGVLDRAADRGDHAARRGLRRGEVARAHPREGPPGPDRDLRAHYRQALALAEEVGLRPLMARCHLGLGALYRRTGKREQAREHLTTAAMMFGEMEMRFWLTQAETELRELA